MHSRVGISKLWQAGLVTAEWLMFLVGASPINAAAQMIDLSVRVDPQTGSAEIRWYPGNIGQPARYVVHCFCDSGTELWTATLPADRTTLFLSDALVSRVAAFRVDVVGSNGTVVGTSKVERVRVPTMQSRATELVSGSARPGQSGALGKTRSGQLAPHGVAPTRAFVQQSGFSAINELGLCNGRPSGNGAQKADIVFLIDTSGSMASRLNSVYTNIMLFIDALEIAGIDSQLGLVLFGQASSDGSPQIVGQGLTGDRGQFAEWVQQINDWTDWGGTEPGFEAIRLAIASYAFRADAQKAFILITDEDSDDLDKTNTIELILASNVVVHAAVDCEFGNSMSDYCDETSVRGVSGGLLIQPIEGPYDDVIFTIAGTPPIIRAQPVSQTNSFGTTATFTVYAIGSTPLHYHWRKNGTELLDDERVAGSHASTLTIGSLYGCDSGNYDVVITNAYGAATSAIAVLRVLDPVITNLPAEVELVAGQLLTLDANAFGSQPLRYQWRKNDVDLTNDQRISGATNATLLVSG